VADDGTFKRRGPLPVLLEVVGIVVALAVAVVAVYFGFRGPSLHDVRPLGGRNVVVSQADGSQYEAQVAAARAEPSLLLAGSADSALDARVYESSDAGASWSSAPAPPVRRGPCGISHPAVAVGPAGLRVYASLVSVDCQPPDPLLTVATRRGSAGGWRTRSPAPPRGFAFDLRPALAVDARGWIFVVWPRLLGEIVSHQVLLFTRSRDRGASWSKPTRIGRYDGVYAVDLASGSRGELYLAVADGKDHSLDVLRSTDSGTTWSRPKRLARLVEPYSLGCGAGTILLRAQPQRCVDPSPSVIVTPELVDVVYSESRPNRTQSVFVVRADRALRTAEPPRDVPPPDSRRSDQFLPAAAFDTSTGDLWACYYDTTGDSTRKHAWFTCVRSADGGGHWSSAVHAASDPSDEAQTGSDPLGYGDTEGLVAHGGVAHPIWTDSRHTVATDEDIYTAALPRRRVQPRLRSP
jgi:hypothetical protein